MATRSSPAEIWLSPPMGSQLSWSYCNTSPSNHYPRPRATAATTPADSHDEISADKNAHPTTRQGSSTRSTSDGPDQQLWACPFCKWKPLQYQDCAGYQLKEISRVKQHLRRRHLVSPRCDTCLVEFGDEHTRAAHVAASNCGPPRDGAVPPPRRCVTAEQQELLERRAERSKTKVEQWYAIYAILFPESPRPPSPFVDLELSPHMRALQAFLASPEATAIVDGAARAIAPVSSGRQRSNQAVALARVVFEQAMPTLLQRYEAMQRRGRETPSQRVADEVEEQSGTWHAPPEGVRYSDAGELSSVDLDDWSPYPSPVPSLSTSAHGSQGQGDPAMLAGLGGQIGLGVFEWNGGMAVPRQEIGGAQQYEQTLGVGVEEVDFDMGDLACDLGLLGNPYYGQ